MLTDKVGFDIPPLQALNLPALMQEVHLFPTQTEVNNISWVCTVLILHCQSSTSTVNDDSVNLNEKSLQHISPWTQISSQTFIVAYANPTFMSVKSNSCFRNWCWDAVKSPQALKKGCTQSTNQNAIFLARMYQYPI